MFKLGKSSKERYDTLHKDLRAVIDKALMYSSIDFSIIEGYRPVEKQMEYYKRGREEIDGKWVIVDKSKVITYVDGYFVKGKHNYDPSRAFDFCVYIPGKRHMNYDKSHMVALGHMFITLGKQLFDEGKITHKVRWGADFNRNGEICEKDTFCDMPHIQLD